MHQEPIGVVEVKKARACCLQFVMLSLLNKNFSPYCIEVFSVDWLNFCWKCILGYLCLTFRGAKRRKFLCVKFSGEDMETGTVPICLICAINLVERSDMRVGFLQAIVPVYLARGKSL